MLDDMKWAILYHQALIQKSKPMGNGLTTTQSDVNV
jgi:hypothetical protein